MSTRHLERTLHSCHTRRVTEHSQQIDSLVHRTTIGQDNLPPSDFIGLQGVEDLIDVFQRIRRHYGFDNALK